MLTLQTANRDHAGSHASSACPDRWGRPGHGSLAVPCRRRLARPLRTRAHAPPRRWTARTTARRTGPAGFVVDRPQTGPGRAARAQVEWPTGRETKWPLRRGATPTVPVKPVDKSTGLLPRRNASMTPAAPATLTQPTHDVATGAATLAEQRMQVYARRTPGSSPPHVPKVNNPQPLWRRKGVTFGSHRAAEPAIRATGRVIVRPQRRARPGSRAGRPAAPHPGSGRARLPT